MDEKEALLTKAKELKVAKRYLEAGELLQKFNQLEPGNKTGLCLRATCLSIEAITRREFNIFEKARVALKQALDADWTWEMGHQLQIDLFTCFGQQVELEKNYKQTSLNDNSKKTICDKMIKIILLAGKFKETPPSVSTQLTSDFGLLTVFKRYWILFLGFPSLLWALYEVPNISLASDSKISFLAPFIFFILGIGVFVLILIGMYIYRKSNKNQKGKNID